MATTITILIKNKTIRQYSAQVVSHENTWRLPKLQNMNIMKTSEQLIEAGVSTLNTQIKDGKKS